MITISGCYYYPWSGSISPTCLCAAFTTAGVNFINILRAAFAHAEPKSVKETVKLLVFLGYWDLRVQKLCINMLVKLTPDPKRP